MIFLFYKVPYEIEITEGSYFMNDNTISEKLFSLLLRCSHALGRGHHHKEAMPGQGRVLAILSSSGSMTQRLFSALSVDEQSQLTELLSKLVEAWHMEHHGDGNCENSKQLHGHHHCDEHGHHEAHGSRKNHGRHHGEDL